MRGIIIVLHYILHYIKEGCGGIFNPQAIYMRDNLFLFVLMTVYPVDTIKQWQEEAINKKLGIKKEVTDGRERAGSIHGDDDDEDIDISDFEDSSNSGDENELRDIKKTRKTRKEIKVK